MFLDRLLEHLPHLVAIVVLAAMSGFLSASETALFALTRQHLTQLRQSRHLTAQVILRLRDDPAALLSTILICNITVNIILYSMLAMTCTRLSGGSPIWSAVLGGTAFVIVVVFAEILPKLFAFVASRQVAPLVAIPLQSLQVATSPIRWLLGNLLVEPFSRILHPHAPASDAIEPEELQQLVGVSGDQGLIDAREKTMLHQLMGLANARVANLMVPRVDVIAFNLADDKRDLVDLIKSSRLLRIPVFQDSIDNIRGFILCKEFLLNQDRPIADLIRPAHFIPEQASVEALLRHFRKSGSQVALVVDEYGGLAGIVALEDVVEEIVGELYAPDEAFPLPPLRRVDDRAFLVDADLNIDDFRKAFDLPIEESRFNTVGGLIATELDRVPVDGDKITVGAATLTVLNMRRRRITLVWLVLDKDPEQNPDLTRLLETPAGPVMIPLPIQGGAT